MKFHYTKCHPNGGLPDDAFTEANGFWLCLYPEDYLRVIQPTRRSDGLVRKIQAAVIQMVEASVCRRSKSHDDWYNGWDKEREKYTPSATASSHVGTPVYVPTVKSAVKTKQTEPLRSRSSTPAPASQPRSNHQHATSSRSTSTSPAPIALACSPLVAQSPEFNPDYEVEVEAADICPITDLRVTSIHLVPDDCRAFLEKGAQKYKVLLSGNVFSCPRTMQALARRMATLDLDDKGPSQDTRFVPCHDGAMRDAVISALGIEAKMVLSIMETETVFEPPSKRRRMSDISSLPINQRAKNLIQKGCFPLFQPARREWTEGQKLKLTAGTVTLDWPPQGWKELSGDLKLLQWEIAAYKLSEATRDAATTVNMPRTELLDRFNFLALPGTSCHHIPRVHKEEAKARLMAYEKLRRMANGDKASEVEVRWLQILECGAMMRDTTEDAILCQMEDIPLRLVDSM